MKRCNKGSSLSLNSFWSRRCLCLAWIRFHSAAGPGGRRAGQSTTELPRSPTTIHRPGIEGLSTPEDKKQPIKLHGWHMLQNLFPTAHCVKATKQGRPSRFILWIFKPLKWGYNNISLSDVWCPMTVRSVSPPDGATGPGDHTKVPNILQTGSSQSRTLVLQR